MGIMVYCYTRKRTGEMTEKVSGKPKISIGGRCHHAGWDCCYWSGSETYRVEDTMIRIAHSQGIIDCNALAMPVAIFFFRLKIQMSHGWSATSRLTTTLKVCDANQGLPSVGNRKSVFRRLLMSWIVSKSRSCPIATNGWLLPQPQCSLLLHHVWRKFLRCFGGCHCYLLWLFLSLCNVDKYIHSFCDSFLPVPFVFRTAGSYLDALSGFNSADDLIIAGSVMPFVPGIALTNSVRDIMTFIYQLWDEQALWIAPHHSCSRCRALLFALLIMK